MTYFPTYWEADGALQQHSEMQAEAGMGAVSMGYDGYDGMAEYSNGLSEDTLDYLGACRWRVNALQDCQLGLSLPVFDPDGFKLWLDLLSMEVHNNGSLPF